MTNSFKITLLSTSLAAFTAMASAPTDHDDGSASAAAARTPGTPAGVTAILSEMAREGKFSGSPFTAEQLRETAKGQVANELRQVNLAKVFAAEDKAELEGRYAERATAMRAIIDGLKADGAGSQAEVERLRDLVTTLRSDKKGVEAELTTSKAAAAELDAKKTQLESDIRDAELEVAGKIEELADTKVTLTEAEDDRDEASARSTETAAELQRTIKSRARNVQLVRDALEATTEKWNEAEAEKIRLQATVDAQEKLITETEAALQAQADTKAAADAAEASAAADGFDPADGNDADL